jgi:hypothetical protein
MVKIKEMMSHIRWLIESQRFKKNRFKRGRGEDFHHE